MYTRYVKLGTQKQVDVCCRIVRNKETTDKLFQHTLQLTPMFLKEYASWVNVLYKYMLHLQLHIVQRK